VRKLPVQLPMSGVFDGFLPYSDYAKLLTFFESPSSMAIFEL
jgi:hypothetical protein